MAIKYYRLLLNRFPTFQRAEESLNRLESSSSKKVIGSKELWEYISSEKSSEITEQNIEHKKEHQIGFCPKCGNREKLHFFFCEKCVCVALN